MTETTEKPRVLVVDDNRDAAETLGTLLKTAGYEVETCYDGKSALQAAAHFEPDACVLDINMPGMDGYQLAQKLREKDPEHAPVLATVTAYEDYGHMEKAVDAGFDLHFTKPADYREVAEQIGECVRKQVEEREAARAEEVLVDNPLAAVDEEDEDEVDEEDEDEVDEVDEDEEDELDDEDEEDEDEAEPAAKHGTYHWLAIGGVGLAIGVVIVLSLRMI